MMEFDHPNVIKLLGICFDADHGLPLIVLPYMVNRDLKSFLVSSRKDNSVEQFPEVCNIINNIIILQKLHYLRKLSSIK